jgi:hypothetical protein
MAELSCPCAHIEVRPSYDRHMALDYESCPADPEEVAEAYVMARLPDADAAAFEELCLTCAACRTAVEEAAMLVRAMREAARMLV